MRRVRIAFSLSVLVLAMLACNAATGLRTAQTEIPSMLTAAPTLLGPLGTAAAEFTPPVMPTDASGGDSSAPAGGLGIKLDDVKLIMEATQQFTFTDGNVDGQPAAIASMSPSAATSMPALADGFSAAFIGDPANLSKIKLSLPYAEDQTAVQAGLGLVTVIFSSILPPDELFSFLPWITENYSKIPVGGSEELSTKKLKFTLSRTQAEVLLDILPAN
jgi:hypothetical protein